MKYNCRHLRIVNVFEAWIGLNNKMGKAKSDIKDLLL